MWIVDFVVLLKYLRREFKMLDGNLYNLVLLPLLIFIARVADVSLGTFRIILFSKNKKLLVTCLAFVEVLIWLLAVRQIIVNLANPICYLAFAGGFATGNYVGLILEEKVALGFNIIRIITRKKADDLVTFLISRGFRVTQVPAKGSMGDVDILFTIIKRSQLAEVKRIIKKFNPNAFYTIEDVKAISEINVDHEKHQTRFSLFRK